MHTAVFVSFLGFLNAERPTYETIPLHRARNIKSADNSTIRNFDHATPLPQPLLIHDIPNEDESWNVIADPVRRELPDIESKSYIEQQITRISSYVLLLVRNV